MNVTKADLEKAKKVEEVDLSEWIDGEGATGHVCAISTANSLALAKASEEAGDDVSKGHALTVRWAILCFCDEAGKLIFDDDESAVAFFADRPSKMVEAICEAAARINGASEEGQEDVAKN